MATGARSTKSRRSAARRPHELRCLALSDLSTELCILQNEQRPPGLTRAARIARAWRDSAFDRVGVLPVLILGRDNLQAHFLAKGSGQETANAVRLPSSRSLQLAPPGRFSSSKIVAALLPWRALPGLAPEAGFFAPRKLFLAPLAFFHDLPLAGALGAPCFARAGFLLALGWSPAVVSGVAAVSSIIVLILVSLAR